MILECVSYERKSFVMISRCNGVRANNSCRELLVLAPVLRKLSSGTKVHCQLNVLTILKERPPLSPPTTGGELVDKIFNMLGISPPSPRRGELLTAQKFVSELGRSESCSASTGINPDRVLILLISRFIPSTNPVRFITRET